MKKLQQFDRKNLAIEEWKEQMQNQVNTKKEMLLKALQLNGVQHLTSLH